MINNNLDMPSEKSKILHRLKELYGLEKLCYSNKINDNLEMDKKIDDILIGSEVNELEKELRDMRKKGSGIFASRSVTKLPLYLAELYTKNNSEKVKNDIKQFLKELYNSKQITKFVYNNLIKTI